MRMTTAEILKNRNKNKLDKIKELEDKDKNYQNETQGIKKRN